MKTIVVTCQFVLLVGILTFAGCADNSPDGLMKQMIAEMNTIADKLESGSKAEDLKANLDNMKTIKEKVDALELPVEEMEKLEEKHQAEGDKASERLGKAAAKDPTIMMEIAKMMMTEEEAKAMQEMQDAMKNMGSQMGEQMGKDMENAMEGMKGAMEGAGAGN